MGKGEIISEKGAGEYTIKLLYGGKQLVQNRLNALTSQIAIIADQIENVKMEIEELIKDISAQQDSEGDAGKEGDQEFLTDDGDDDQDDDRDDGDDDRDDGDDDRDDGDDDRDDGDDDQDDGDPENPEPDPEDPEPDPEPPDESNPPPLTGDSSVEGKITDL